MKTCLIDLPTNAPYKVPVVLTNETDHDVSISQKCVIGEVSAFQRVISQQHSVVEPQANTDQKSGVSFNFEGSQVDAEW